MEEGKPLKGVIKERTIGEAHVALFEHISEVLCVAVREKTDDGWKFFVAGRDAEAIIGRAVMMLHGMATTEPFIYSTVSIEEAVHEFLANEQADRLRNFMTK